MTRGIQVTDPMGAESVEPVAGLRERTAFSIDEYRLSLLRIDEESSWHTRDGATYGWVRTGDGHLAYDEGSMRLESGDFLRVPANSAHRYETGDDALEVLAVIESDAGAREVDTPTGGGDEPTVVGPDELVSTVQSPDLIRETPFPDADILMMRVRAEGGAAAGWHHHGDNVYFGYAVDGPSETEYGSAGEKVARIEMGECFHVPPGLVHRDTNPTDEAHTGIIWLCGGEPWVVNLDGPE